MPRFWISSFTVRSRAKSLANFASPKGRSNTVGGGFRSRQNRIDAGLVARLPAAGFYGLSTYKARASGEPAPGLRQVNCHADPVDWQGSRGFAGAETVLAAVVDHLRDRRTGAADAAEPTGILTHHQVHDEPAWAFLAELAARVRRHAAGRWVSLGTVLGTSR